MTHDKAREQQDSGNVSPSAILPSDFLWGASTSAYQIEGATCVDGRGRSIWDDFSTAPGKTHQGQTGETAANHYYRVQEDVNLMSRLGLNAYCFSIAWPRVLPEGSGTVNEQGLDFYDRLVDTLLEQGIAPVVKLYHWDLPSALHHRGGWLNRDIIHVFADYAEIVARRLGDRVGYWITHNEPWCAAYLGYGIGIHAPGIRDVQLGIVSGHHILLSHGLAVPRIRAHTPSQAQVGITLDIYPVHAANNHPETLNAVEQADTFRNRWFFDPVFKKCYPESLFSDLMIMPPRIDDDDFDIIGTPIDFLGLNYYSRWVIRSRHAYDANDLGPQVCYKQVIPVPEAAYTAAGWEIYPEGLYEALERIHRDYAPPAIIVTENGATFRDCWDGNESVHDPERVHYLRRHLHSIEQAVAMGIPVRGHFVWSLLDNFEWAEGYSKRFGIVYVDFPSQKRIIKESGHWYAAYIAAQREQQSSVR